MPAFITEKFKVQEEQQFIGSIRDIFKVRRYFINLLILIFAWITTSFNLYLVTYLLKYIKGDIFTNIMTNNARISKSSFWAELPTSSSASASRCSSTSLWSSSAPSPICCSLTTTLILPQ